VDYSQKKIKDLVAEHYVFASVLYYLGIAYYDFEEDSLEKVCKQKGIDCSKVVSELELILENEEIDNLKLLGLPTDLIVEYLKHAHYLFIKKDLPFLVKLINHLQAVTQEYYGVQKELKEVFPLFIEDFVHHIYEEEDTLFDYILNLKRVNEGKINASTFSYQHEKFNIQKFAIDHEIHDDEMRGIRFLMEQFPPESEGELNFNVLLAELRRFEQKLMMHAKIENEILFPKALMLEKQVKKKIEALIKLN
jgi:regulator of cell morphogenesis and NO signaling